MSSPQPDRLLSTSPFIYTTLPVYVPVALAAVMFAVDERRDLESLGLLALIAGVAYVALRAAGGNDSYADRVSDGGDHLVVRMGQHEERIFLSSIEKVEQHGRRPPYVQLTLKYSSKFGREIAFLPAGLFTDRSWGKLTVCTELEERVRAAQSIT